MQGTVQMGVISQLEALDACPNDTSFGVCEQYLISLLSEIVQSCYHLSYGIRKESLE
jgi:hypothetical protein